MATIEEEILLDEEENKRELAYIRSQLPEEVSFRYSDEDILWIIDSIVDYYFSSGVLETTDDEVDINMDLVAEYVCRAAKKEGVSNSFSQDDIVLMAQADLDFQEQNL